jgi:hypothetical protein
MWPLRKQLYYGIAESDTYSIPVLFGRENYASLDQAALHNQSLERVPARSHLFFPGS